MLENHRLANGIAKSQPVSGSRETTARAQQDRIEKMPLVGMANTDYPRKRSAATYDSMGETAPLLHEDSNENEWKGYETISDHVGPSPPYSAFDGDPQIRSGDTISLSRQSSMYPALENDPLIGPGMTPSPSSSDMFADKKNARGTSKNNVSRTWIKVKQHLKTVKVVILFALTVLCSVIFAAFPEENYYLHQFSVSQTQSHTLNITGLTAHFPVVKLYMTGSFLLKSAGPNTQNVTFELSCQDDITESVVLVLAHDVERIPESTRVDRFNFASCGRHLDELQLVVKGTSKNSAPVAVGYTVLSTDIYNEVFYAAAVLIAVYILIIFELVHRTIAAMLGALAALTVLAALNEKPSLDKVLEWLDYETLCLLFGMMVLVSIFCETGFFDWAAIMAYRLAKGRPWPLITILCVFSAVVSAFLDNVTTILLLTPVTIRLCEVLQFDPKHILIAEVMFSNIGGTATAIGDPPNVLIVSNRDIIDASNNKINFSSFTMHMVIGSICGCLGAYILLRIMYRKKELLRSEFPPEISELKHEIDIWKRTSARLLVASREEEMVKSLLDQKVLSLEKLLERKIELHRTSAENPFVNLKELESQYKIQNKVLLVKSSIVVGFVILMFFLSSFVKEINLSIGWVAILGAIWLLVLSDYSDLDSVLDRIEWATLLFFAALFVLMEALNELGLIDWISSECIVLIKSIDESSRLAVAIIIIIWISAIASSFIDNIPFTTAMIPVVVQLSQDKSVGLPLDPLIWALAFGACFGGNGTLIGASANVVCAGIAETHGHGFTFWEFFKVGFPTMIVTTFIATCYLLVCHVALDWEL